MRQRMLNLVATLAFGLLISSAGFGKPTITEKAIKLLKDERVYKERYEKFVKEIETSMQLDALEMIVFLRNDLGLSGSAMIKLAATIKNNFQMEALNELVTKGYSLEYWVDDLEKIKDAKDLKRITELKPIGGIGDFYDPIKDDATIKKWDLDQPAKIGGDWKKQAKDKSIKLFTDTIVDLLKGDKFETTNLEGKVNAVEANSFEMALRTVTLTKGKGKAYLIQANGAEEATLKAFWSFRESVSSKYVLESGDTYIVVKDNKNIPDKFTAAVEAAKAQAIKDGTAPKDGAAAAKGVRPNSTLAGKKYGKGDKLHLNSGTFKVVEYIASGRRGDVYEVKDSKGNRFAIKIARDLSEETLDSIRRDGDKEAAYKKLGLPHANTFDHGFEYALKELIEGQRGDDWILKEWKGEYFSTKSVKYEKLIELFMKIAKQKAHVSDLNRANLLWSDKRSEWIIIDSGDVKFDVKFEDSLFTYRNILSRNWGKPIFKIDEALHFFACQALDSKLNQSLKDKKGLKDITGKTADPASSGK